MIIIILYIDHIFDRKTIIYVKILCHLAYDTLDHIFMIFFIYRKILAAIKLVKGIYDMKRGFTISILLMNGQFESLCGDLAEMQIIALNTVSNDEHVLYMNGKFAQLKNAHTVCVTHSHLSVGCVPAQDTIEMVYCSNFWLNSSFTLNDGVSTTISPQGMMIVRTQIDYSKHCNLEFGSYVQNHEEPDNSSMATRTTGAITLCPTGTNDQGGYYFFSLTTTSHVLNRNHWTALTMPHEVTDQVHIMACR